MGISITQLLIILGIILLLFGTKRLKNIGSDLGGAIKGFKKSMSDEEERPASHSVQNLEKSDVETSATASQESASNPAANTHGANTSNEIKQ